jgi:hypothetical protein
VEEPEEDEDEENEPDGQKDPVSRPRARLRKVGSGGLRVYWIGSTNPYQTGL